ncbi:MAG: hypothetical protein KF726_25185 [Anaerolineae bacterium]|nr:hypothetical protein [Anaerolineae bacterium]
MNARILGRWITRIGFLLLAVILALTAHMPATVEARQTGCNDTFRAAMNSALTQCANIGVNTLCLGNPSATINGGTSLTVGQSVDLNSVASLALSGYDGSSWGVAMLRLMANLPGNNPGAPVTMIAFGNVSVAGAPGTVGMQSFYLQTTGNQSCQGLPGDGVMIQSPQGQKKLQLVANGVQLSIGSTVFLDIEDEDGTPRMKIRTLEGEVTAQFGDQEILIEAGEESGIEIQPGDEEGEIEAVGELEDDHPIEDDYFTEFPVDELPEALTFEQMYAEWADADDQEGYHAADSDGNFIEEGEETPTDEGDGGDTGSDSGDTGGDTGGDSGGDTGGDAGDGE